MAKKSGKGKEKKEARKAENARAAVLAARVRALEDASAKGASTAAAYPAFQQYSRKGLAACLGFFGGRELPAELLDWAVGLTRRHMAALYDACPGWGWNEAKKRAELAHPSARYLVAFQQQQQQQGQQQAAQGQQQQQQQGEAAQGGGQPAAAAAGGQENSAAAGNGGSGSAGAQPGQGPGAAQPGQQQGQQQGEPVAFLHYRFEEEEGEAVLYCYEIQVEQAVQGKGLGRFLMQLLELMGCKAGVDRLMLTVFHENEAATSLYKRLGYVLDDDSPGAVDPAGDHKYEIMTKRLVPRQ